jgi:hypothetical protein
VANGKVKQRDPNLRLAPGTVLAREYRGVEYRVVVTADGRFDFKGQPFQSLSVIAREITGTRWSGPVFFGLKARAAAKSSRRFVQAAGRLVRVEPRRPIVRRAASQGTL